MRQFDRCGGRYFVVICFRWCNCILQFCGDSVGMNDLILRQLQDFYRYLRCTDTVGRCSIVGPVYRSLLDFVLECRDNSSVFLWFLVRMYLLLVARELVS